MSGIAGEHVRCENNFSPCVGEGELIGPLIKDETKDPRTILVWDEDNEDLYLHCKLDAGNWNVSKWSRVSED